MQWKCQCASLESRPKKHCVLQFSSPHSVLGEPAGGQRPSGGNLGTEPTPAWTTANHSDHICDRVSQTSRLPAWPKPDHRHMNEPRNTVHLRTKDSRTIIRACCFKPQNFDMSYYTATANSYSLGQVSISLILV